MYYDKILPNNSTSEFCEKRKKIASEMDSPTSIRLPNFNLDTRAQYRSHLGGLVRRRWKRMGGRAHRW